MQQTRERFPLVCTDKLFNDFVEYSTVQMRNNDLDPEYLVLGHFTQGASLENAVWATILHVSYCHIISLLLALQRFPEPAPLDDWALKLPIFVDRRNLRGGKLGQHINHWLEVKHAYGGLVPYLTDQFGDSPTDNWLSLRQKLLAIWGNGRWAVYKTAEILWRINGFAVYPTDMDNSNSSGPRKGLAFFYGPVAGNTPAVIAHLDAQAEDLLARLQAEGIDIEIDELETMLCEFHSMAEGRYYPGHDIDLLQEQMLAAQLPAETMHELWAFRRKTFDTPYLGEYMGWSGVDKARNRFYRERGVVPLRGVH